MLDAWRQAPHDNGVFGREATVVPEMPPKHLPTAQERDGFAGSNDDKISFAVLPPHHCTGPFTPTSHLVAGSLGSGGSLVG